MAPRWPQDGPKSPQGDPKTMPYRASSGALRELLGSLGRLSEPSSSHRGSLQKPIAQMSKKRHPSCEKCTLGVCWGVPKTAPRRLKKVSKTARYNNSLLSSLCFSAPFRLLFKRENVHFVQEVSTFGAFQLCPFSHTRGGFKRLRDSRKSVRACKHKVKKYNPCHAKCPFSASQDGPETAPRPFQNARQTRFMLPYL